MCYRIISAFIKMSLKVIDLYLLVPSTSAEMHRHEKQALTFSITVANPEPVIYRAGQQAHTA
jgi:hypothetical protein